MPGFALRIFEVFLDVLDGTETKTDASMLEECTYCHRKFRFDRIAKHETRCPESKPKPAKLDVAKKLLAGTPGEKHIPEVKLQLLNGAKLPPLAMRKPDDDRLDMLQECSRCKRRFSTEALEKHAKRCTGTPRTPTSRVEVPGQAQTTRGKPRFPPSSNGRDSSQNRRKLQEPKQERCAVERPLTPKKDIISRAAPTSNRHRSQPSLAYPSGAIRFQGQACYEELELDVADWLDG